jgi:hypothetical protein
MKIAGSGSASGSTNQRYGSADSDPDPDPRKMSWIRNTAQKAEFVSLKKDCWFVSKAFLPTVSLKCASQ